ncbi:MAG: hypothetical protein PHE96_04910 [Methylococcales bacterium]|nr:hypothetical protein [Methylococcales bacterium]
MALCTNSTSLFELAFGVNALLIHRTRAVTASSFTSHEKTKHSLEMYRLCLAAKKTLDETQVLIRKFEKHQRDLRSTMSRALHPVRTLRKALQERRVERMVKSLKEEMMQSSKPCIEGMYKIHINRLASQEAL